MRKLWLAACEMPSIHACFRWFASVMRLRNSCLKRNAPSRQATRPKTTAQSKRSSGNWRPLTATSSERGQRFLLCRVTTDHRYSVYVYDTDTTLCWRCDFSSQLERNTYVNHLRTGQPSAWPQALVIQHYVGPRHEHELY